MIIHAIEQNTDGWEHLRAGLPTASSFKSIITSKGEPSKSLNTYATKLAAEKFAGKPLDCFEGNAWTERGHELEIHARAKYTVLTNKHVHEGGFIEMDDHSCGCSPDGFVKVKSLLEIKCLKTENHVKTLVKLQKKRFALLIIMHKFKGN